jgi:DNA polymerase III epsilon subunit-like protein
MTDGFPPQTPKEREMSRYVMVDVETDGPIPGDYSMLAIGAVVVEPALDRTFKAYLRPISERWVPEALAVGGFTREQTMTDPSFRNPGRVMTEFHDWLYGLGLRKMIFIADNNGFDWSFVNWYSHHFLGENPFGFSSQNLNSLYKGLTRDAFASFKHLRRTRHDHDPLNDAMGNAEALLHMIQEMGLWAPV